MYNVHSWTLFNFLFVRFLASMFSFIIQPVFGTLVGLMCVYFYVSLFCYAPLKWDILVSLRSVSLGRMNIFPMKKKKYYDVIVCLLKNFIIQLIMRSRMAETNLGCHFRCFFLKLHFMVNQYECEKVLFHFCLIKCVNSVISRQNNTRWKY